MICRSEDGIRGSWCAFRVSTRSGLKFEYQGRHGNERYCCETFQTMEEHIEACTNVHSGGARFCVECVNDSKGGLQCAVGNAGLERFGSDVKNRGTGRFRPCSSSSWNLVTQSQLRRSAYNTLNLPAIRGRRGWEMAKPFPMGALMKSYRSASLYTVNLRRGQYGR